MTIEANDMLPDVNLHIMREGRPKKISTKELTVGKTVIFFGLPGAFTPTCSEQHLPGFIHHADTIKGKGVSEIVCVSVNDPFVMDAWGRDRGADEILMAGDGNGEFTKALGLEMDGTAFGMGMRSQRYAMIVRDGVVTKIAVESPGAFEVSKAEVMLDHL